LRVPFFFFLISAYALIATDVSGVVGESRARLSFTSAMINPTKSKIAAAGVNFGETVTKEN
jgi:hypothetical protein